MFRDPKPLRDEGIEAEFGIQRFGDNQLRGLQLTGAGKYVGIRV